MLIVPDAEAAISWYRAALGATSVRVELFGHNWSVGNKAPLQRRA